MKKLLFLPAILWLASCTPQTEPAGPSETDIRNDANKELVFGYIKAVSDADFDAMSNALADDFIGYGPGIADSVTKSQTIENWKNNWDELYSSVNYDRIYTGTENPTDGPYKGDWVMDWANITVDYKDGGSATFMFNGVFQVDSSKIVKSAAFYNVADILTQRGFNITPPTDDAGDGSD